MRYVQSVPSGQEWESGDPMDAREEVIKGLKILQNLCKEIPGEKCHKECPYEDICLMISLVGYNVPAIQNTPDIWDFKRLRG